MLLPLELSSLVWLISKGFDISNFTNFLGQLKKNWELGLSPYFERFVPNKIYWEYNTLEILKGSIFISNRNIPKICGIGIVAFYLRESTLDGVHLTVIPIYM